MKKGVLLINLGTPDEPTAKAVRPYLRRFLGDPRVINTPRSIWLPILNLMILPTRPAASAAKYQQIWSADHGSPLAYYTEQQAAQLQRRLPDYQVAYAYSYSKPLIADALTQMETAGVQRLTIVPLYPQYSTTTIGSIMDDINRFYYRRTHVPELHIINGFADRSDYLDLLAHNIQAELNQNKYDQIIISFHGIPVSYAQNGDPYPQQCQATTEGIRQRLDTDIPIIQTYQSKFGPAKWLTPATADLLKELPKKNIKRVLVISPSFVADCLETLHELDIENRHYFMKNGGQFFKVVRCFNADPAFTSILQKIVLGK
ncbi:ferrochelatase [Limosilactobacillus sp.]|uniref:ferrochelatase n=1 Tax=Limosilactobacillus sp. TaxID=2773925 RepID=UPI003F0D4E6C